MKFEPDYLERLAKIITDNGLTEITMEDGEQAITIRKEHPEVVVTPTASPINTQVVQQPALDSKEAAKETPAAENQGKVITSPMVGTFYVAASPDAAPFVEIGTEVSVGDVVCIIEAMKLMNEIKAEQAGRIVKICVKNGEPVEFGQVLMYIE